MTSRTMKWQLRARLQDTHSRHRKHATRIHPHEDIIQNATLCVAQHRLAGAAVVDMSMKYIPYLCVCVTVCVHIMPSIAL